MQSRYLPFVDWMKAVGIALIVYGHVAAATSVRLTPPVYPKQLGVAFFVFVTGYTLARESRDASRVVFNRVFELFLYGLSMAMLMSVIGLAFWGDANQSNYLPFALGLNIFLNDFPANPTTWYIGTYIHLLLLWAVLLRKVTFRPSWLVAWALLAIVIRAVLMQQVGLYFAYMVLFNWLEVLTLGLAVGSAGVAVPPASRVWPILLIGAWPLAMSAIAWDLTFPFMGIVGARHAVGALLVSLGVSAVYLLYTWAVWGLTCRLPDTPVVRFLARNTGLVFIAHMPVYYFLEFSLRDSISSYPLRVSIEFVICLIGLAMVSECLRRLLRPDQLRQRLAVRLGFERHLNRSLTVAS